MFKLPKPFTYGAAALAAGALVLAVPRAAHAVAATLVQVVTASPVPNLDVERIARVPYESTQQPQGNCPGGNVLGKCTFVFTLPPSGYRLVVENVSGSITVPVSATSPPIAVLFDYDPSGPGTAWSYTATLGQPFNNVMQTGFNQQTRAVFDSNDTAPTMIVTANWQAGVEQFMTLSGYLENCTYVYASCAIKVH
jgi:hypothetical protein